MEPILTSSLGWRIDYYMERTSIELAELFGAFSKILLVLFLIIVFCSCILWLVLPFIEIAKKKLLKQIHMSLMENEKQLSRLNEQLQHFEKLQEIIKEYDDFINKN